MSSACVVLSVKTKGNIMVCDGFAGETVGDLTKPMAILPSMLQRHYSWVAFQMFNKMTQKTLKL